MYRILWITLGVSVWFLLTFFHQRHYDAPTPVSRLNLIMAICLERRLEIDSFHQNTPDKALINGHYYSDKAPGTAAIALIGSAPSISIGRSMGWTAEDKRLWLAGSWAGCAMLNIILAVGFCCLVKLLADLLGNAPVARSLSGSAPKTCSRECETTNRNVRIADFQFALATAVFIVFGGMAWPYATMMFSHGQTIGCISIGLWFLHRASPTLFSSASREVSEGASPQTSNASLFWSGFAFGWALNSEYTTGLIVFGVPLILLWTDARKWFPFLAGIAGPCLLIPLYSLATIGVPWKLPYSYQAAFPQMKEGLYAIQWPDATTAWNLLFSFERGLIFWCPFIALAFIGYLRLVRQNRQVFFLTYFLAVLQLMVISGRVWDWPAGPSFSARYLAPIVPLLAVPCAFALREWPRTGSVLGFASVLLTGLITVTDATPTFDVANPLLMQSLPMAVKLDFNPSLVAPSSARFIGPVAFACICPLLIWILPKRLAKRAQNP